MDEADARGLFGCTCDLTVVPFCTGKPSVKWIVVAEPLVCERCKGDGTNFAGPNGIATHLIPCVVCKGTARPDVEIVSDLECPSIDHGRNWARHRYCGTCGAGTHDEDPVTIHGVVTIGAAVPIGEGTDWRQRSAGGIEPPCITVNSHVGTIIFYESSNGGRQGITDQFGGQAVTPGHYAHPILSSPDGTGETRES